MHFLGLFACLSGTFLKSAHYHKNSSDPHAVVLLLISFILSIARPAGGRGFSVLTLWGVSVCADLRQDVRIFPFVAGFWLAAVLQHEGFL
jgi:hypothetical protein